MQIIPIYRHANELSPVRCDSLLPCEQSCFASTCTFISPFLIAHMFL